MKNIKLVTENTYLMGYNENNIVCCYYPLTKEAKEFDLPLLPSFGEADIVNEVERIFNEDDINHEFYNEKEICNAYKAGIYDGYKAAQSKSKQFSLEDIKKVIAFAFNAGRRLERKAVSPDFSFEIYREELIQSLSTQQLPKEFEPRMYPKYTQYDGFEEDDEIPVMTPMTFTNSEGKQELVGTYKY